MTDNNLHFKIDQLRQDKIIYAVDSCAFSIGAMLALLLSTVLAQSFPLLSNLAILFAFFALGFMVFMGIGNVKRYQKIKELEKKL